MWAPAPRSLPENPDLALGKYARAGSDRGHDARATCRASTPQSDDVVQSFIGGRGEVFFMGLLVRLPCRRVPDLQIVDRSDHDALLGKVGVAAVVGRQRDPALRVGMLLVGGGGQGSQERAGIRIASRRLRRPSSPLFELGARGDREAVVLALCDHQPSLPSVAAL